MQSSGKILGFFEEFQELAQRSRFAVEAFSGNPIELTNPVCGDWVGLWLDLDRHGRIICFEYKQKGCWPVACCLELLGQEVLGAYAKDLLRSPLSEFIALVKDVPVSKRHAFSLAHRALQQCLVRELLDREKDEG